MTGEPFVDRHRATADLHVGDRRPALAGVHLLAAAEQLPPVGALLAAAGRQARHRSSPTSDEGPSRRRSTSTSQTASVPAAAANAPRGRRTAPSRSARAAISRRAAGLRASIVHREVTTIARPPGRVRRSDLTTKWLCKLSRDGLWTGSCRTTLAKGTLPIVRSKNPSGRRASAKLCARMSAEGYRLWAIAAVVGSSSTPTTSPRSSPVGPEGKEVPGAAARLEHPAAGKTQFCGGPPHGRDHLGGGVVGVECRAGRRPPRPLVEEPGQFAGVPRPIRRGQDRRPRAARPSRPIGPIRPARAGRPAAFGLQCPQHAQGGQVRPGFCRLAGRGQIALPARPEIL